MGAVPSIGNDVYDARYKVMVLAGGPDRERAVSLQSGQTVASALKQAGHEVLQRDPQPDDLSCLDEFAAWQGDVIFPALHGPWGEGGPLLRELERRNFRYVGCDPIAAELCMDKVAAKEALHRAGLPTPRFQVLARGERRTIAAPVVVKAPREGSSIDLAICRDEAAADRAVADIQQRHERLLLEQFIPGREITVGVITDMASPGGYIALPPIHIVPATEFYDYDAKYQRDDTQYRFDIDLPGDRINAIKQTALSAFFTLGCRHLSRIDFIVDEAMKPWILEVNTLPGFTSHSLLPMAAKQAGVDLPQLTDRLIRAALS